MEEQPSDANVKSKNPDLNAFLFQYLMKVMLSL